MYLSVLLLFSFIVYGVAGYSDRSTQEDFKWTLSGLAHPLMKHWALNRHLLAEEARNIIDPLKYSVGLGKRHFLSLRTVERQASRMDSGSVENFQKIFKILFERMHTPAQKSSDVILSSSSIGKRGWIPIFKNYVIAPDAISRNYDDYAYAE